VVKSKIWNAIKDYNRDSECVLHRVDIDTNGLFLNPGKIEAGHGQDKEAEIWKKLVEDEVCSWTIFPYVNFGQTF